MAAPAGKTFLFTSESVNEGHPVSGECACAICSRHVAREVCSNLRIR